VRSLPVARKPSRQYASMAFGLELTVIARADSVLL